MNVNRVQKQVIYLLQVIIFLGCPLSVFSGEQIEYLQASTNKPFEQVLEDLEFAVTERNFRMTNTLNIGKGIKTRGDEDFPENSVLLFCNLKLAKKMLELDPYYLNHCPYRVNLREIDKRVIINAPLLPITGDNIDLDKLIYSINEHITEIVDFGAETWQE